eukprot:4766019-Amphidinium_carterae.1
MPRHKRSCQRTLWPGLQAQAQHDAKSATALVGASNIEQYHKTHLQLHAHPLIGPLYYTVA